MFNWDSYTTCFVMSDCVTIIMCAHMHTNIFPFVVLFQFCFMLLVFDLWSYILGRGWRRTITGQSTYCGDIYWCWNKGNIRVSVMKLCDIFLELFKWLLKHIVISCCFIFDLDVVHRFAFPFFYLVLFSSFYTMDNISFLLILLALILTKIS